MDSARIQRSIKMLRDTMNGEYSSATRVIDALLDLRLLSADSPALIDLIDSILLDVPGRFVAPNDWWRDQLDRIDGLAAAEESHLLKS